MVDPHATARAWTRGCTLVLIAFVAPWLLQWLINGLHVGGFVLTYWQAFVAWALLSLLLRAPRGGS